MAAERLEEIINPPSYEKQMHRRVNRDECILSLFSKCLPAQQLALLAKDLQVNQALSEVYS